MKKHLVPEGEKCSVVVRVKNFGASSWDEACDLLTLLIIHLTFNSVGVFYVS